MADIQSQEAETKPSDKPRILFIDDSKLIRKSALKMLAEDFDIALAEHGKEGWEILQTDHQVQVVFTDLDMPEMNGFQLIEAIRTHADEGIRNLPVIMVTGTEQDEDAKQQAFELGVTDFITKPFKSADIRARATAHANYQRETKRLEGQSNLDSVTGTLNAAGFAAELEKSLASARRHHEELTLMLVEIADFKDLFMTVGRRGSEKVMAQVAKLLAASIRTEDTLARVGLSRFALLLPKAKPDAAEVLGRRVVDKVADLKLKLKSKSLSIGVCVGVYTHDYELEYSVDEVMQQAEAAVSAAMLAGSGKVEVKQTATAHLGASSVDASLMALEAGEKISVEQQLPQLIEKLIPLVKLMTDEQKNRLLGKD